jgi:putative endonuclease
MKLPAIYILASRPHGTLYIGVTSDLTIRIYQHQNNIFDGFCTKYNVHTLVYYEIFGDMYNAITREKQLKHWRRAWKIELIESVNPNWRDLYADIV